MIGLGSIPDAIPISKRPPDVADYLIRTFNDIEHMEASLEAFYGSEAWQKGPRTVIIEPIKTSVKAVITLPETAVEGLRN